jgi:predicted DCC family thiol-disulfide oxidoreductase YuxK
MKQEALVPLTFLPLQAPDLFERFKGLEAFDPETEICIVDDEGAVYQGAAAWITILYALRDFREWAFALSTPAMMPLARKLVHAVSNNRMGISSMLGWSVKDLEALPDEKRCMDGACEVV